MSQVKRGVSPLSLFKQGKLIIFGVILAIVCFAVGFFSGGREEKPPVLSSITVVASLESVTSSSVRTLSASVSVLTWSSVFASVLAIRTSVSKWFLSRSVRAYLSSLTTRTSCSFCS